MLDFITPRETVLITTRGNIVQFGKEIVKENVAPTDWHMPVDHSHFAISLHKNSFTAKLIRQSGVCVVNFLPFSFAETVVSLGKISGHTTDKFALYNINKEEAEGVDCCKLKDAVAYIGCHIIHEFDAGDFVLFVGKVVLSREIVSGVKRLFHIGGEEFTSTRD